MTTAQRQRSPARLARWLQKVMASAGSHLPALSSLGTLVHEHASWHAVRLEGQLHALHDNVTALDWGANWPGPEARAQRAELAARGGQLGASAERATADTEVFLQRSQVAATLLEPALVEFLREFRAVERIVERCGEWLQELDDALASGDVKGEAHSVLEDKAGALRSRLALLQAVDRSARNVHALADSLAITRPKLAETIQGKVKPSCAAFCSRLAQLLQGRLAPPEALSGLTAARSDAQIWVTQAVSLALRMQASQDKLVREAASLRHRCGLMPRAADDVDVIAPAASRSYA